MKKVKQVVVALAFSMSILSAAWADEQQTAGGWGQNCDSGVVTCSSGRTIDCNTTVPNVAYRSECTQHTGDVGWVACAGYDAIGNQTSYYSDQCP